MLPMVEQEEGVIVRVYAFSPSNRISYPVHFHLVTVLEPMYIDPVQSVGR